MKKIILSLLLAATLGSMAGCGTPNSNDSAKKSTDSQMTTFEKAKKQGYVTVGFANEKPYAYATPDGKLTGEAVEVARTILERLGINEMQGVLTEFGSLIPGLKAGRFDMITAGMFITPQRALEVDFANPEYSIGEALVVKKGNPKNLHSYTDIDNNPEAKVAAVAGGVEHGYLLKSGVPKERIVVVPDNPSAIAALQSGRVDAITMTGPAIQSLLNDAGDPNLERVMDFQQPVIDGKSVRGYGATAFRKEDADFREAFNRELEKLKESGELLKIIEPFGFTAQELPGNVTAEQLSK